MWHPCEQPSGDRTTRSFGPAPSSAGWAHGALGLLDPADRYLSETPTSPKGLSTTTRFLVGFSLVCFGQALGAVEAVHDYPSPRTNRIGAAFAKVARSRWLARGTGSPTSCGERDGRSAGPGQPVPFTPSGGQAGKGAFYGLGLANHFSSATDRPLTSTRPDLLILQFR